jgi:putative membrane protein
MWHMGDGWGWWMAMGWLWMVVFWGLIIWGIYALVNRDRGAQDAGTARPDTVEDPLRILERRYARGEIDHEQFEAMRARLTRQAGVGDRRPPNE